MSRCPPWWLPEEGSGLAPDHALAMPRWACFAPTEPGASAFWDAAAQAVLQWAGQGSGPWVLLVPHGRVVAPLQQALRSHMAGVGQPWVPPAIRSAAQWLESLVPATAPDPWMLTLTLDRALTEAMPEAAQRAPAERLLFAQGLGTVLAALVSSDAAAAWTDPDWAAIWAGRWGVPAATAALQEDLALLRRIAEALGDDLTELLQGPWQRVQTAAQRWARRGGRVVWLDWQAPGAEDRLLWQALLQALPAQDCLALAPDWAVIGQHRPVLAAAWPEVMGAPRQAMGQRRAQWQRAPRGPVPVRLHAADRETEAQLAAQWVLDRLLEAQAQQRPVPRLALVAADRWLARRVRALLDRATVAVDDREGWLVSTTVAASCVLGWLELVASDGQHDALRAWLEGRFVRVAEGARSLDWLDEAVTRRRYVRGWQGLLSGADDRAPPAAFAALRSHALAQRAAQPLLGHVQALEALLRSVDAPRRLACDAAGRQVLGLLERLRGTAQRLRMGRSLSFAEFHAVCRVAFEQHHFFDAVQSPVVMIALGEAAGADFDAVLVLGAAQGVLPGPPPALPLVNETMRAVLGLPTAAAWALRQQRDLTLLCALTPATALTCRTDPASGQAPSPWLERLQLVVMPDLRGDAWADCSPLPGVERPVTAAPLHQPALALAQLPRRLTVGGIGRWVQCPYDFLVRDGWRLAETPQPVDAPGTRERGDFAHEILHRWHVQLAAAGVSPATQSRAELRESLWAVTEAVAERELAHGGAVLAQLSEWRVLMDLYLDWVMADALAAWQWRAGEEPAALELAVPGVAGGVVRIEGRIDRLDQGPDGWRLIDYKLGDAKPLQAEVQTPEQAVQLGLYAWMAGASRDMVAVGYLSLRRGAVKWLELAEPVTEVVAGWQARLPVMLQGLAQGEPLVASGQHCSRCASRGVCRKGHWS